MPPLTHNNHLTLDRRERAARLYELRRLVTEPRLRAPLWDTGEAIEGTRTAVNPRKVWTGELTPTGRARTTQVYDVEVELHAGIVPPAVATRLLWAHDPNLRVTGVVTDVDGRQVVVHVGGQVRGKTRIARRAAGQADTWIAAEPPYDGPPAVPGWGTRSRRPTSPPVRSPRRADPPKHRCRRHPGRPGRPRGQELHVTSTVTAGLPPAGLAPDDPAWFNATAHHAAVGVADTRRSTRRCTAR